MDSREAALCCSSIWHRQQQRDNSIDPAPPVLRGPPSWTCEHFASLIGQMVSSKQMVHAHWSTRGWKVGWRGPGWRVRAAPATQEPPLHRREAGNEEDGSKGRKQFADFHKKEKKVIINTYELRH